MYWLALAGAVGLLTGTALITHHSKFFLLTGLLDQTVFHPDDLLRLIHVPAGAALIVGGGWLVSQSYVWPGLVGLLTGTLYLFFPSWYAATAALADRPILPLDSYIRERRRQTGAVLIVFSIFIFFGVFNCL